MFFAAVAPLLPHYSDELGLSKSAAGVLAAAYPAGTLVGSLPAGWLAARVGRQADAAARPGAARASRAWCFGFANSVVLLDAARFAQGVGGACCGRPGMAWLVSAAPADRRGELIGSALGAAIVGVLLGPGARRRRDAARARSSCSAASRVVAVGLAAWAWTDARRPARAEPGDARRCCARCAGPAVLIGLLAVHAAGDLRGRRSRCSRRCGSTSSARAAPRSARSSWWRAALRGGGQPGRAAGCPTASAGSPRSGSAWRARS